MQIAIVNCFRVGLSTPRVIKIDSADGDWMTLLDGGLFLLEVLSIASFFDDLTIVVGIFAP